MSYDVEWTLEARTQLADWWLQHVSHRRAITEATARLDQILASNPLTRASPLCEGLFAINVFPLRADFELIDKSVTVVAIHWLTDSDRDP